MEIKKNPKADLKNKRGLLLEIGLVVSLLLDCGFLVYAERLKRIEGRPSDGYRRGADCQITRQDQKPPEPPKKVEVKVIADLLQVVTNDTKITTEVDFYGVRRRCGDRAAGGCEGGGYRG